MHWAWNHSQSKGNTRIALLYVADQVRTPACEVRLSYADLMAALNATRTAVRDAIKSAEKLGELEIIEPGKGTRAALYRLSKAVGYVRPELSSGRKSDPLGANHDRASGSESVPQGTSSGRKSDPLDQDHGRASGRDSDPQGSASGRNFASSGRKSDPHHPSQEASQQAGWQQDDVHGIPEWARPLVDGCTNAGIVVRWPFQGSQWFPIHAMIKKSGVPAMLAHAQKAASRTNVESAKYFLQGWSELPPIPRDNPFSRTSQNKGKTGMPPWCRDPDCDEKTRLRDVEDTNGLRYSAPCNNCHPSRKDTAA